jgi:cardiolipin synthase A/B
MWQSAYRLNEEVTVRYIFRLILVVLCVLMVVGCNSTNKKILVLPNDSYSSLYTSIHEAKHSIDLVMYGFTDQAVANALIAAHQRGVNVRVMLQHYPYKNRHENDAIVKILKQAGVAVHWANPQFSITHQKTLVVDHALAYDMTFNFTDNTLRSERNFALVVRDKQAISEIERAFNADWHGKKYFLEKDVNLVWSPNDAQTKIVALINSAKHSLRVYNQEFASSYVMRALEKKAQSGVTVQLIVPFKNYNTYKHNLHSVARKGVQVKLQKQLYTHAKAILVDAKYSSVRTFVGSMNFSYYGLDKNRELGMIVNDPDVAKRMLATFQHDWQHAEMMPSSSKRRVAVTEAQCSENVCRLVA